MEKKENTENTEATIISLSRGFAFARTEGGPDVFIHADKLNGAFLGDRVILTNLHEDPKGLSAHVDSVTEKSSRLSTGTLHAAQATATFTPDGAIRYDVPVTKKSASLAKDGDKVQAKLHRRLHSSEMEAELIKCYGKAGSARICSDAILDQYGIASAFSAESLAEAENSAARGIMPEDLKDRLDLRKLSICTIDGADAKDLDDAISVSKKRRRISSRRSYCGCFALCPCGWGP